MKDLDRDKLTAWLENEQIGLILTARYNPMDAGYYQAVESILNKIDDGEFDRAVKRFEDSEVLSEETLLAHEKLLEDYPYAFPTYERLKMYIDNIRLLKHQNDVLSGFIIVRTDQGA